MHARHRKLFAFAVLLLLVGWLAWTVLLTESEEPLGVEQGQTE